VPSRTDTPANRAGVRALALALGLAALVCAGSASARAQPPTTDEIARALETVKADPNLAPLRTIRMLRWKDSTTPRPSGLPPWLTWLLGLFQWFDQTARLLVWGVALALAAFLVIYIARAIRDRPARSADSHIFVAPIFVRDLDIRPESLPDDIGAAARRLWDRSERRAALALLYRGMLSRLVHLHEIPIRDSTTEADCLVLAAGHLAPAKSEYAARLIREWERAVYGREDIQTSTVYGLCDGFAPALDRAALVSPMNVGSDA
jgi:hypothetical protein